MAQACLAPPATFIPLSAFKKISWTGVERFAAL